MQMLCQNHMIMIFAFFIGLFPAQPLPEDLDRSGMGSIKIPPMGLFKKRCIIFIPQRFDTADYLQHACQIVVFDGNAGFLGGSFGYSVTTR